ncbi:MAG: 50S ribosomal protein L22 [Kiritimatiellia bacterium]|jgi:large subunit ribosomal protein L22
MQVTALTKYVRIAPSKAMDLAKSIQGLPVAEALKVTQFSVRKAAKLIGKTLKSAIANAEHNANLAAEDLKVKEAVVMPGPVFRRFWARSRGSASPVLKRTSHIRITLTDGNAGA